MSASDPFIDTQRRRDRSARAGLQAGDCICVCAACGARMVVPPAAGHGPLLTHHDGCERSWGFTPDEAILYDDGSQATVDNWPNGVEHTRVLYREAFATLGGARAIIAALAADHWNGVTVAQRDAALSPYNDGGMIGPLPNGDVIEVEVRTWERVRSDLTRWDRHERRGATNGDALAAWNAEYGIGAGG